MRILISNDDGIHAAGLKALYKELKKHADVTVVAPLEEKSTTGHSLTIHKPLRILSMGNTKETKDFYAVTGSPADCVYLGVREIVKATPDLIVSGINRGANMGQDVYYSGTVSAARESCIFGVPSLAVSLDVDINGLALDSELNYDAAAKVAASIIRSGKVQSVPKHTFLNLNVPNLPFKKIKGIQLTHQGFRYYSGSILCRKDHRGRDYFWLGGKYKGYREEEGSDCAAVGTGYASLTPMKLDSTDLDFLVSSAWELTGKRKRR